MRNMRIYLVAMLCLMCVVMAILPTVSGDKITKTDVDISQNDYESEYLLGLDSDDEIDVSVTVQSPSGARIDVYILDSDNWVDYPYSPFSALESHEDVSSADFTFDVPETGSYYLIIDNMDNSRSNDAVPTGDVTVDLEYDDPFTEKVEEALWTATWFCIGIVIVVVVILIVIIFIIIKVGKKEGPPQYPPPQYPGYQQYPQPPYQQPPYQQPPYQQPPSQPPQQPPQQPPR